MMAIIYVRKGEKGKLITTLNKPLHKEEIFDTINVSGYAGNFDNRTYDCPQDLLSAIENHIDSQNLAERLCNMNM